MNKILGRWARPGVELDITRDKIVSSVVDPYDGSRRTFRHDYLMEANRIQMYSPTIRDIKNAFRGELRIIMITPSTMTLESETGITNWDRR